MKLSVISTEKFLKFSPHLESLEVEAMGPNEENLLQFGLNYGLRLKRLKFIDSSHMSAFIKKFLNYCRNLLEIDCEESTTSISEDKLFLPEFQIINCQEYKKTEI